MMSFKSKNSSGLIALFIAILAIVWIVSGYLFPSEGDDTSVVEAKEETLVSVRSELSRAEIFTQKIIVTGRTHASQSSNIAAEVAGRVVGLPVTQGSFIGAEETLIRLDESDRRSAHKQALAALDQAEIEHKASLKLKQRQFNSEIQLATARSSLEAAKAEFDRTKIALENSNIKAPYDGVLETRLVDIGDYVQEGDQVAVVVDLDPIKIEGSVTETQVADLSLGDKARIILLDEREFEARITFISSSANDAARTFLIELEADNEIMEIIEGLTAKIELKTKTVKAHQISPSILILDDQGVVGVKVLDQNNVVSFKPVEILSDRTEGMWISGLADEERVITVGQSFVIDGQTVETSREN